MLVVRIDRGCNAVIPHSRLVKRFFDISLRGVMLPHFQIFSWMHVLKMKVWFTSPTFIFVHCILQSHCLWSLPTRYLFLYLTRISSATRTDSRLALPAHRFCACFARFNVGLLLLAFFFRLRLLLAFFFQLHNAQLHIKYNIALVKHFWVVKIADLASNGAFWDFLMPRSLKYLYGAFLYSSCVRNVD